MFDLNGDGDVDAEEFEQVPIMPLGSYNRLRDPKYKLRAFPGAGDHPAIDVDGKEAPRARQHRQHPQGQEDELGARHLLLR